MNCAEFRGWFARLLAGGDTVDWPEKEYHLHLLTCPACQMILSTSEICQAVTDVASHMGCSVEELMLGETAVRRTRRKITLHRVLRRASVALGVGAVVLLAVLFRPGGKAAEEPSPREVPQVAVAPPTPVEFATSLAGEDFSLTRASQVKTTRALMFVFQRKNPAADHYEFAKAVALSGFEREFSDAPLATISIVDEDGQGLFMMSVDRDRLPGEAADLASVPGHRVCRVFRVIKDRDGKCLPRPEDAE